MLGRTKQYIRSQKQIRRGKARCRGRAARVEARGGTEGLFQHAFGRAASHVSRRGMSSHVARNDTEAVACMEGTKERGSWFGKRPFVAYGRPAVIEGSGEPLPHGRPQKAADRQEGHARASLSRRPSSTAACQQQPAPKLASPWPSKGRAAAGAPVRRAGLPPGEWLKKSQLRSDQSQRPGRPLSGRRPETPRKKGPDLESGGDSPGKRARFPRRRPPAAWRRL